MSNHQPSILSPIPGHSRYLEFRALPDEDYVAVLKQLSAVPMENELVVGLGFGLVQALTKSVPGLRPFPSLSGPGCTVPSTQADMWFWIRGEDRGGIFHTARRVEHLLEPSFGICDVVDGFKFDRGLDLTGYEDGTENPEGAAAMDAAIVHGGGPGLDGSSFVAIQQWAHDLDHFEDLPQDERDTIIGRRLDDNEEIDDAPVSAHVKRTAQESFDPDAFVLRRSMPWSDADGQGLMFVAFGNSFDAFEAQLHRMCGLEDGITDSLFRFSRPLTGGYYWCPPIRNGCLDLSQIGF